MNIQHVRAIARKEVWHLLRDPMGAMGLVLVLAFLAMALFAPWLAPYDPLKLDVMNKLRALSQFRS